MAEKTVSFNIRAKDETSAAIKKIEAAINSLNKAASKKQVLQETVRLKRELRDLERQYDEVAASARKVAGGSGEGRDAQLQTQISQARELKTAIEQRQVAIHRLTQLQKAASSENVSNLKRERSAAIEALQPLIGGAQQAQTEQRELAGQIARTTVQIERQGQVSRRTLANMRKQQQGGDWADREIGAISSQQGRGFLGLRPYELTNFGYQINDVVTGLAMGQQPLQVFAQQIGQIAQLFPKLTAAALRFVVGPLGGIVTVLGVGVARVIAFNNNLRDFEKTLALNADAANYNAKALAELEMRFKRSGDAIKAFVSAGVKQSEMESLLRTTQGLSRALGINMSEAAEKVLGAFTKNVDGVRELDKSLNFLTAAQLRNIRQMEEQGDKAGALAEAQRILQRRLDESASKGAGPWSQAFTKLRTAFDRLLTSLSNTTIIQLVIRDFDRLARIMNAVATAADKISSVGQKPPTVEALRDQYANLGELDPNSPGYQSDKAAIEYKIEQLTAKLKQETAEAEAQAAKESLQTSEAMKKAQDEAFDAAEDRWEISQREAELLDDTSREQYIQKQLWEDINEAKKEGVELTQQQLDRLREMHGLTFDTTEGAKIISDPSSIVDRIIQIESGGRADAKNAASTATGLGQFIESTWLSMFRKYFPERAESMTRSEILELRKDAEMSRKMVELYVQENSRALQAAGVAVNAGNAYLAHFLGSGGAIDVARAQPGTPISNILPASKIRANPTILAGKTAGDVVEWANRKMSVSDEELGALERINEIEAERRETVDKVNEALDERVKGLQFETSIARESARNAFILKEVEDARRDAEKEGLTLSKEREEQIRSAAAAAFDAQNAEKNAMEEFNRLLEVRGQLVQQATRAQSDGDENAFAAVKDQIAEVDLKLREAASAAIAFWQSVGGPDADLAILKINTTIGNLEKLTEKTLVDAKKANEDMAQVGASAFGAFAEAVANGENAAQAFWNALRQGIANFIIEITTAIMKQMLFNAISGGATGGTGGAGGWISSIAGAFVKAPVAHSGGVIGEGNTSRIVNPAVFAQALRYHTGGIAGLRPNEVPSILMRGEEVLTADDPRHVRNSGGAANVTVKNVNVINPAEVMANALQDEEGQRVIINWMNRNSSRIGDALSR